MKELLQDSHALKKELAFKITKKLPEIQKWYSQHALLSPPPFYSSIDLRDAGYKIAPVDSNLYPAGFNNICQDDLRTAPPILKKQIERIFERLGKKTPQKIAIMPEFHTSNKFYLENLFYLKEIFLEAGFEVQIAWKHDLTEKLELETESGKKILIHPSQIENGILKIGSFVPECIILNNDFSGGYPNELDRIEQPIIPSHRMGWHSRRKSNHFFYYNQLAKEFADIIEMDPFHIQIETQSVGPLSFEIDYRENPGLQAVHSISKQMLEHLKLSYSKKGIQNEPFLFIKNNSGTYGMGIMVIHSADELLSMNRRTKNKMSVGKNNRPIESVVIQEGIPTATIIDRLASEPVIYLMGCELIGGFLRTNSQRGTEDNLNSQGMVFRKLCMSDFREFDENQEYQELQKFQKFNESREMESMLEIVYGSIARLSALAAGKEISEKS